MMHLWEQHLSDMCVCLSQRHLGDYWPVAMCHALQLAEKQPRPTSKWLWALLRASQAACRAARTHLTAPRLAQVRLCGQHAALPQHVPGADGGAQRRERAGRRRVHPRARDRRDHHRPQHRRLVRRPAQVLTDPIRRRRVRRLTCVGSSQRQQRTATCACFSRGLGRLRRPARLGRSSRNGSRTAHCRAVRCIQGERLR